MSQSYVACVSCPEKEFSVPGWQEVKKKLSFVNCKLFYV